MNNIIYYGFDKSNDVYATNIRNNNDVTFDVYIENKFYDTFKIKLFGQHQILNALAVITVSLLKGISKEEIKTYLYSFKGAKRRFNETKVKNVIIIDDYAHHPTEITATIDAARKKYPDKKIITVFQGHTFSRVKEFYKEICNSLKDVDKAYFPSISPAREQQSDYPNITSKLFLDNLEGSESIDINTVDKLLKYDNSVIIFMSPKEMNDYENKLKGLIENES